MKKILNLNIWLAAIAMLFMVSCEDETATDENFENPLESEYTSKTTEETKKDVEDAGIALVAEIDALEDEEAIDVMVEMMNLFGGSEDTPAEGFNVPLKAALAISDDTKNSVEVFNLLKATTEEGLALSDSFAAQTATYTYNFTTDDFDKTENTDAIVILFPGKEGDLENTAEITISDFTVKEITEPRADFDLPNGIIEFPTGLQAVLKYNSNILMSFNMTADYMSDGTPTLLENVLNIGTFSFTQKLTHSQYMSASFDYSFKSNGNTLIAFGAEANGNWSESNIDANIVEESNTYTYTESVWDEQTQSEIEVEYSVTDTWTETYVEEIINNSNAYIQFMDLKAVGQINIKAIADGEQAFDLAHEGNRDDYGDYDDATALAEAQNSVDLVKANAKFVLVYSSNNSMIAALEPYTVTNTDTYTWDGVTYTETDYDLDFKMVFNDESPISLESYVENELTGFFDSINDFITTINTEHNTSIDPVDFSDDETSSSI